MVAPPILQRRSCSHHPLPRLIPLAPHRVEFIKYLGASGCAHKSTFVCALANIPLTFRR
jgi:hypothetical protein